MPRSKRANVELLYWSQDSVERIQQIKDDLVKQPANGRTAESGCHMLKKITRQTISEIGIKSSRRDKTGSDVKSGPEVSKSAAGADHFSEGRSHSPAQSQSDKPNPAAPSNKTSGKKDLSKSRSKAQITAPVARIESNYSIETARAAFSECAAHASRFVVGTPGRIETADASFVYKSEGQLEEPKQRWAIRPRDGRPPFTFETALENVIDVKEAKADFDKQSAHLKDYTRQFKEIREQVQQKPWIKRVLHPASKHLIEDVESLSHRRASTIIAITTEKVKDGLENIKSLKTDPHFRELAVDIANEANAGWKIDGFVKLHQRLEKIVSSLVPTARSSRSSSPQRERASGSQARKDSVMATNLPESDNPVKTELAAWHADLAEYRGFLSELEPLYARNKLTRKS